MRFLLGALTVLLLTVGPAAADQTETFAGRGAGLGSFLANPVVSGFLLALGMMALVIGVLMPGTGAAEIVAVLSLGLFFGGRHLAGADLLLPVCLFLVGMALIALELLVIPGVGAVGILGAITVGAAVVLSFGDLRAGLAALLAATSASIVCGAAALRYLPENRLVRKWMVLQPPAPGARPEEAAPAAESSIGWSSFGTAKTDLRPGGAAEFDGRRIDVVADGQFIKAGRSVEVVKIEGSKIVVREIPGQDG
ncbi:MAG: hypothetical protein HY319_24315 [Armatimonadetes bacterium]|nr:hypothetical protein [Armatimonadota bacterium]